MPPRYGTLSIGVVADTRGLASSIRGAATDAGRAASAGIGAEVTKGVGGLRGVLGAVGKAAAVGLAGATVAAGGFAVQAFKTAARAGEMDATLRALAQANNLNYEEMQRSVASVRGFGIEAGVAQNLVAQFARNQLELGQSTDLARVAQDAAVISGENSSDVLDRLIHGITTQNSLVLRNAGVNVQAGQAVDDYAKSLGKSRNDLTAAERAQAVLNAVLEAGTSIAGAYTTAMQEPGKVLRSFPRLMNDIELSIGTGLVNGFGPLILKGYELTKVFSAALMPGGKLAPVMDAIGIVATKIAAPITTIVEKITAWIQGLDPGKVQAFADGLKQWGPLLAVAAAGLVAVVAPQVLSRLPMMGGAISNIGLAFTKSLIPGAAGSKNALGGLSSALGPLAAGFGILMAVSPEFRAALMDIGRELMSQLMPALREMWAAIQPLIPVLKDMAATIGGVLADAVRALAPVIGQVLNVLVGMVEQIAPVIGQLGQMIATTFAQMGPVIIAIVTRLGEAFVMIMEAVQPLIPVMLDLVVNVFQMILPILPMIADLILALVDGFVQMLPALLGLIPLLIQLVQQVFAAIAPLLPMIIDAVIQLAGALVQVMVAVMPLIPPLLRLVIEVFMALFPILPPILDLLVFLVQAFVQLLTAVMPLIPPLVDLVMMLLPVLIPVITLLARILSAVLVVVIKVVVVTIQVLVNIIVWLVRAWTTLVGFVLTVVVGVWRAIGAVINWFVGIIKTVVSWIMGGSPGLVPAFEALGAVVTWVWENLLKPVFDAFAAVGTWLWENILKPAFEGMKTAFEALGTAISWVWENVIKPVWDTLSGAWSWLWENVLQPAWVSMKIMWGQIGDAISWVWENVIKPVWDTLSGAWSWLWDNVLYPGWVSMKIMWGQIGDAISWVWNNIIKPAWDALWRAGKWLWENVLKPAWDAMSRAWNAVGTGIKWVWETIIKPAWDAVARAVSWLSTAIGNAWNWIKQTTENIWNGIAGFFRWLWDTIKAQISERVQWVSDRISGAWNWIKDTTANVWNNIWTGIQNVWENIKNAVRAAAEWVAQKVEDVWNSIKDKTKQIWENTVNVIKDVWEGLKKAVGSPIYWVATNIIRPLIDGINKLTDKIGLGNIPTDWIEKIPHFARGGKVPGRGTADTTPIMAAPGEWVLTRAQSRAIGYDTLRRLPRYAEGGPVGPAPRWPGFIEKALPVIGGVARGAWDKAWGFSKEVLRLEDIGQLGGELLDEISGKLRRAAAEVFKLLVTPLRKAAEPWEKHPKLFPERWAGKTMTSAIDKAIEFIEGHSVDDYEGGGANVDELAREVMDRFKGLRITSALRKGDPGYHGKNLARDLGGPQKLMEDAGAWMSGAMVSRLLEGIMNPTLSVKNGAKVPSSFWGAGTWAGHRDHIHMAAEETAGGGGAPRDVESWRSLVTQMAQIHRIPHTVNSWLRQIKTESNGNPRAIQQVRDVNWPHNKAQGLIQVTPRTASEFLPSPFGRDLLDPRVNVWVAMAYAKKYNKLGTIGRGHGYARGGIISEHVIGVGQRSGEVYQIGERGPEVVSPFTGTGPEEIRAFTRDRGITINVYPQPGQDERAIAAAVSRELAWAQAGGAR